MKTTREKFLTVAEAEKATGVHYTVNHSGKMEGMQSLSTSCLCNKYCRIDQSIPIWYVHIVSTKTNENV